MTIKPPYQEHTLVWGPKGAYRTWFAIYGTLPTGPAPSNKTPVILLHGGPGATGHYMSPLSSLARSHHLPVILYDQLGNGRSSHFPERKGNAAFWTPELFVEELQTLVNHLSLDKIGFSLLGNSWGGLLASIYASQTPSPAGLRRLISSNTPADMSTFVKGCRELIAELPADVRETIERCEREGRTESPEYEEAVRVFLERHLCRTLPWPKELQDTMQWLAKDATVYNTMNGPSEFNVVGSLKGYSIVDRLEKIEVPTLVLNGRYDEVSDEAVLPYFQRVKRVRWVTLENAAHMSWIDEPNRYRELVGDFLVN